ncbi:MAG: hypothetical protein SF339_12135 [Blastocatellia bacterium]|nr:hypothetical protein [Blastocatellia bacterium]
MPFVSVTRLRLRWAWHLPAFYYYAIRSISQAKRTPGSLYVFTVRTNGLVFWTVTLWDSREAMRSFRNSGAHFQVMPKLAGWCDEATYVHWEQERAQPPALAEMYERITREGIVSRVKSPSPNHSQRTFPKPRGLKNES